MHYTSYFRCHIAYPTYQGVNESLQNHDNKRIEGLILQHKVMDPGQHHTILLPSLTSNLELLKSGQYSDMTLSCGSDEFHLHRALMCPRSAVLRTWIDSSFLV